MKIALLTTHWANNYGASLQTYATFRALQEYGDVFLLDYRIPYAAKGMQLIRLGSKSRDFLRVGKDIFRLFPRYRVIKKFKRFTQQMPMTRRLTSTEDFESYSTKFDVFIVGSDQIWNPSIVSEIGELDVRFMLDFVKDKPKISYASSLGSYKYSQEQKQIVSKLLSDFKALSVREKDSAEYLNSFLSARAERVLDVVDPTLLYTKKQWINFFDLETCRNCESEESFILVYALKKDSLLKDTVDFYRSKFGYKVVTIDQDPFINYKADIHIKDASPQQFIQLFASASFVITNSFHGTCFSVNFNKKFIVITPPASSNRIINLLSSVELQDRFVEDSRQLSKLDVNVDFVEANRLLQEKRDFSLAYLEKTVNLHVAVKN